MTKSKYIEGDLIFIFFDFLRNCWKEKYRLYHRERIKAVILKLVDDYYITKLNVMAYIGNKEHKYLRLKTPWIHPQGEWDFTKWKKRYWFLVRDFVKMCAECGAYPQWQAILYGYGFEPFEHNKQGITDFFDHWAWKYQKEYIRYLVATTKRIINKKLDPDWIPVITLMNEPRNKWKNAHTEEQKQLRHQRAHDLADWHYEAFQKLREKGLTDIEHLYVDITLAERPVSNLVTLMPKNAQCEVCGLYWRNWNNPEYGRKLMPVKHSVSIKEDRPDQAETFLHSWKHLKTSEDGSHNPKCRGPKFEGSHFRVGDADQVHELLIHDFGIAKEIGARRIHGLFPMETSEPTPFEETQLQQAYIVNKIQWDRFAAARDAEREIWG